MPSAVTNVEDLRRMAERRVPRMFYDYADSRSWTEGTYRSNTDDFASIKLRQRVAVDMTNRTLASTMAGQQVAMPVALAPTGLTGMQHADGEILAARAAKKAGVPFTLSTMSICSIEDVAADVQLPFWFQLYVMRDRVFANKLIDQAKAAGCSALVLTLDLQILGQRHKDIKERAQHPAQADAGEPRQPRDQAALVLGDAAHEAPAFRQHPWARGGRGRHELAVLVDGQPVRPEVGLGRRPALSGPLGRQADPEGHPRTR